MCADVPDVFRCARCVLSCACAILLSLPIPNQDEGHDFNVCCNDDSELQPCSRVESADSALVLDLFVQVVVSSGVIVLAADGALARDIAAGIPTTG